MLQTHEVIFSSPVCISPTFLRMTGRGPLMRLAYSFDMLPMGVCTTRHWQTNGAGIKCLYCMFGNIMLHVVTSSWYNSSSSNVLLCSDCVDKESTSIIFAWLAR